MADEDELRELRIQRQKVAEHLQWLDQLIANCEVESSGSQPPSLDRASFVSASVDFEPELDVPELEFDPRMVKSSIRSQSFGCIAVAILVVAIALFTLWVLPGLIYD